MSSSKPPMSLQPRCTCHSNGGMCVSGNLWAAGYRIRIYRRRFKQQIPKWTASTGIDPMPLPTSLRRDDMSVESCTSHRRDDILSGACNNHPPSHFRKPPMSLQPRCTCHSNEDMCVSGNLWAAGYRIRIYRRRFKEANT